MGSKATIVILGLVIAAFVYAFFQLYERVEHTIDLGYSKEARQNPYLAAERYLMELDIDINSHTEMTILDSLSFGETLFVSDASLVRSEGRVSQLLEWVGQGGRLIFAVSEDEATRPGKLTTELGITVEYVDAVYPDFEKCDESGEDTEAFESIAEESEIAEILEDIQNEYDTDRLKEQFERDIRQEEEPCLDQKYLTKMEFEQMEAPFFVHFPGKLGLSWDEQAAVTPFYYAIDDAGVRFAQIEWGDGLVTIMASPGLWSSERIGLFDNAFSLWAVSERTSPFHILYGSAMPPLLTQIWRYGSEFVIVAVLALILWIWHIGKRVLPARNLTLTDRRSVLEHLEARSDFLWKNAEFDALIQPLKDDILQRCKIRFPGFNSAEPEKRIEIISNSCNLSQDSVQRLLSQNRCNDALQCQRMIEIAQQIKNKL